MAAGDYRRRYYSSPQIAEIFGRSLGGETRPKARETTFIMQMTKQGVGEKTIFEDNVFLTKMLPRTLSADELNAYLELFAEGKNDFPCCNFHCFL